MADKDEISAQILDAKDLDTAELAPTPAQEKTIAAGCIANALANIAEDRKQGLKSAVEAVEGDLSQAIDMIKKRRARMSQQMDRLRASKDRITGGTARISSLYTYAEPAIEACPAAANAARLAKEGSDIVHARLNEIEYQMALISAGDLDLATQERELSGAMTSLDEMVLSLR